MTTRWAPFALVLAVSTTADPRPPRLERRFRELAAGYDAYSVLYDARQDRTLRVNDAECRRGLPPCSTFKVFNALAGLQSGVVQDEATLFKWDRTPQPIPTWEKDHNLATAVRDSHAREISREMLGALPR